MSGSSGDKERAAGEAAVSGCAGGGWRWQTTTPPRTPLPCPPPSQAPPEAGGPAPTSWASRTQRRLLLTLEAIWEGPKPEGATGPKAAPPSELARQVTGLGSREAAQWGSQHVERGGSRARGAPGAHTAARARGKAPCLQVQRGLGGADPGEARAQSPGCRGGAMGAGPGRAVRGGAVGGVAPGRGLLVGPGQGWAVPVLPDLDGPAVNEGRGH